MDERKRQADRFRNASARRAKRVQLLGVDHPSCAICGYDRNPASLEAHHIAGEANQELSILLCRTCHDNLSDTAIDTMGACVGATLIASRWRYWQHYSKVSRTSFGPLVIRWRSGHLGAAQPVHI